METKMIGVTSRKKKRAEWVRGQTGVEDILVETKQRKWTWAGHVARRQGKRRSSRVTDWIPREKANAREGDRKLGGQARLRTLRV